MGQVAFYEKDIGLVGQSREASERADLAAFEFAEGELANYQEITTAPANQKCGIAMRILDIFKASDRQCVALETVGKRCLRGGDG